MSLRHDKSTLAAATVWMAATLAVAQGPPPPAAPAGPTAKTVALSPGSCASVATGDLVTFTWNPMFSPASSELRNMELVFTQPGSSLDKAGFPRVGFVLEARSGKQKPAVEPPIASTGNGFYLVTFRANLETVQPGQYTLVDAKAIPGQAQAGDTPVMTNNPRNSYFCLEVTGGPAGKSAKR